MHLLPALLLVLLVAFSGRGCASSNKSFLQWMGAFVLFGSLGGVIVGLLYSPAVAGLSLAWIIGYSMGLAQRHTTRLENRNR